MTLLRIVAQLPALLLGTAVVATPAVASAAGLLTITANRTLTANYQGTIRFGANNITLDCKGFEITPSSNTSCTGGKCGIQATGRAGITIKNCLISGFNATGGKGVEINSSSNITLHNNYSDLNRQGFVLTGNSGITATQVYARFNSIEGVDVNNTSGINANGLFAYGNGGDGVDLGNEAAPSTHNHFDFGTLALNGGNGIEQDFGMDLWVLNFAVYENSQNGITLDDVHGDSSNTWSGAWISANDIYDQSSTGPWNSDGIRLNNVTRVWLDFNSSYSNEGFGGYLDDGTTITVDGNYFDRCNTQMRNVAGSQCGM